MRNDDFSHYYGGHKRRSNYVIQKNVIHKGKTYQFRADYELHREIQALTKEFNQSESKVIKDILEDFFLDRKNISWQNEIKDWK